PCVDPQPAVARHLLDRGGGRLLGGVDPARPPTRSPHLHRQPAGDPPDPVPGGGGAARGAGGARPPGRGPDPSLPLEAGHGRPGARLRAHLPAAPAPAGRPRRAPRPPALRPGVLARAALHLRGVGRRGPPHLSGGRGAGAPLEEPTLAGPVTETPTRVRS